VLILVRNTNIFRLHPVCYVDSSLTYSSSMPMTLCRVDSGPPCRLCYAVLTPFGSMPMTLCQPHASNTNFFAYNDQTLGGSTTTSPQAICETTSLRLHRHRDLAIMQLYHRNDFTTMSTSFGALTHDMQDYDFKARFESLPDSTTRLDTWGLLTRE
jgi:hypothetical protein